MCWRCLSPLWKYTALKRLVELTHTGTFESPLEIHGSQTVTNLQIIGEPFESPLEIHGSQTTVETQVLPPWFESPLEIHGSQTMRTARRGAMLFESPLEIHGSQTGHGRSARKGGFESPLEIHGSQTSNSRYGPASRRAFQRNRHPHCSTNLQNYNRISQRSASMSTRFSPGSSGYSRASSISTRCLCRRTARKKRSSSSQA